MKTVNWKTKLFPVRKGILWVAEKNCTKHFHLVAASALKMPWPVGAPPAPAPAADGATPLAPALAGFAWGGGAGNPSRVSPLGAPVTVPLGMLPLSSSGGARSA